MAAAHRRPWRSGCFGVSIRQSTLAAPMAVVVVGALADRRGPYRVAAAGIGFIVAAAAIHFLAAAIPGQGSARFDPGPGLQRLRLAFQTLALCLSPALVVARCLVACSLASRRRRRGSSSGS